MHARKEKIYFVYVSKHKSKREKQVIILMISNGEGRHNIAALLRRLTFKNNSNFTTWIFFIRLDQQTYLNHIKRYTKIKSFVLPCGDTKILEFNQKQNYDKIPFSIYADLESLIEKMDGRKINSEKLSTTNVGEHVIYTLYARYKHDI